jgi:hypothetical protein
MVRVDVWTIVGGVAATLVISWILNVETLFFLAIVITAALALLFGVILGGFLLSERLFVATEEKAGWREVRTEESRQPIAG